MITETKEEIQIVGRGDLYRIKAIRHLTPSTYILRFARNGMDFRPGQHLNIGIENLKEHREYSIYSGADDTSFEVLIKEVDDGRVSRELRKLRPGDKLSVKGPYGYFLADILPEKKEKILFVASGTGLAPFHSYIKTHPEVDYKIVHGIRDISEAYEKEDYKEGSYIACTSRGNKGHFAGRLTDYLKQDESEKADKVYLCGNSDMIYDAMEILKKKGYRHDQMFTEVYF